MVDVRDIPPKVTHKSAKQFAEHLTELHKEVWERLEATNKSYKLNADRHRWLKTFEEGDLVMVHMSKECYSTGTYNKLKAKKSPCPIT